VPHLPWCGDYYTRLHFHGATERKEDTLRAADDPSGGDAGFPVVATGNGTPVAVRRLAGDPPAFHHGNSPRRGHAGVFRDALLMIEVVGGCGDQSLGQDKANQLGA
jgi:hypothetical protein